MIQVATHIKVFATSLSQLIYMYTIINIENTCTQNTNKMAIQKSGDITIKSAITV